MYDKASVVMRNVSKQYVTTQRGGASEKASSRIFRKKLIVTALEDVSLASFPGDYIGILGRNGSGKSTLMRLIAGGESPNSGQVLVSDTPTLLGVSAALQAKLPGIENIRLGLLAQGVSPNEIQKLEIEILDFADIGDAVYRPMNTYSSGMGARLKFAISTAVKRKILLVDEALATGDAAFNDKARERMQSFLEDTGTIFLVSHSLGTIRASCNRVIWLHNGRIVADGPTEEVCHEYARWATLIAKREIEKAAQVMEQATVHFPSPPIVLKSEVESVFRK